MCIIKERKLEYPEKTTDLKIYLKETIHTHRRLKINIFVFFILSHYISKDAGCLSVDTH